jgi:CBS domain-containing protein
MDHDHSQPQLSTAGDVMTPIIISASPESSVRDVAQLLLDARISAVPVVDGAGGLLGIVSEGDLLGRSAGDRLSGEEWWLSMLAAPGQLEAAASEAASIRRVGDIMQTPVITVDVDTPIREVAELLRTKAIKRVPVMRGDSVVGIVSRADLLRAFEALPATAPSKPSGGGLAGIIAAMFGHSGPGSHDDPEAPPPAAPPSPPLTADNFRNLVEASEQSEIDEKKAAAHVEDLARRQQIKTMLHDHIGTEMWDTLMNHARVAAAHGLEEFELLRFPADLCSDSGRMINNADPDWGSSLRGEAAELRARWEHELKPAGFGLVARVVDYPQGMPGNIAMVLVWQN